MRPLWRVSFRGLFGLLRASLGHEGDAPFPSPDCNKVEGTRRLEDEGTVMKVFPKVSDAVAVPNGTPHRALFVDVTVSAKVIDGITKTAPSLEDRARGYWTVANLKAAYAEMCDWLIAREHGVIVGVWKINRKKGWIDPSMTPKKTWPTDKGDGIPRLGCEVIEADEYRFLIGKRAHLGRCPNSLRAIFED